MTKRRRWCIGVLVAVCVVVLGYNSASLSLDATNAAVSRWLPEDAPAGAQQSQLRVGRSVLFAPFVTRATYSKSHQLDPYTYQTEKGIRYYFTLYGLVIPLWTSISSEGTMDVEGP
jgi:hypothetical protein